MSALGWGEGGYLTKIRLMEILEHSRKQNENVVGVIEKQAMPFWLGLRAQSVGRDRSLLYY